MKPYLFVIILLPLTATAHTLIQHYQDQATPADNLSEQLDIPSEIGGYTRIAELEVPEGVQDTLQTEGVLMQQYVGPHNAPVALTVVHADKTRRSLHFPQVCLTGQGWEVHKQFGGPVGIAFEAQRLVISKGNEANAVLYWFKTGDRFTGSYFTNSFYWAVGQLTFQSPTATMIELTTPIGQRGEEAAFRRLEDFALRLEPVVRDRIR